MARALRAGTVAVVAEVKRRSPSKGEINRTIAARGQALAYAAGGAAALSILTEPDHFGGSAADLEEARRAVSLPLLKKDFHIREVQLLEARALGASAVLLIARALSPARLRDLARLAADLGLETLVEVRDDRELAEALSVRASMIGVNNRDLETLQIEPSTCDRLIPLIPHDRIAVAESGIHSRADVERYAAAGADAVLVGSSISASADPAGAVRALTGVAAVARRV